MIQFFNGTPLNSATQLVPQDPATGDGVNNKFIIANKNVTQLGGIVQAGNVQYSQFNGGFTKSTIDNSVTVSTIPPQGSQIAFPGVTAATFNLYDQTQVDGVTVPNVGTLKLYLADITQINTQTYQPIPGDPGLAISIVDLITAAGAQTSWCQLACADPVTGNALAYLATGSILYLPPMTAFGILNSSSVSGGTTLYTATASSFQAGELAIVNIGGGTAEEVQITGVNGNLGTITVGAGLNFPHSIGEYIYHNGWPFWMEVTVPINVTSNQGAVLIDLGLKRRGIIVGRS